MTSIEHAGRAPGLARAVWCAVLWLLPFAATWIAHRMSAGEGDVNMFGMTQSQHRATIITLLVSVGLLLLLCAVLKVGFLWLPVALVTALALSIALGFISDNLVQLPQALWLVAALIVAPLAAAALTGRRARA